MQRDLITVLQGWKTKKTRKPVLLRGARQVGKTYLVRDFGTEFKSFIEINFELRPGLRAIFDQDLDPSRIVRDLSIVLGKKIMPGETLLFFDEIQECPKAIQGLRYFYEMLPELHVIAAGSLINFVLEQVGVPVGRVLFLYLYPLSFLEFLSATDNELLREVAENQHSQFKTVSEVIHQKLLGLLGEYMAIGGMPEAVKEWIDSASLTECSEIHSTLIDTYRQDFAKYARKNQRPHVETVFAAIPRLLGKKFVYTSVTPDVRSRGLRAALELLSQAQVAHIVYHSSANGPPLGSEINPLLFKVLFLDIALSQTLLGITNPGKWILNPNQSLANFGNLTEAFVGQELLAYGTPSKKESLFYWLREKKGSRAEVDYVISINGVIVPVEVKSGTTGSLKSLNLFLKVKDKGTCGLQFSRKNLCLEGPVKQYPLYAVSQAIKGLEQPHSD